MPVPVVIEIIRQHAEMAAFLWTLYDYHLLHPGENPDMDEERLGRLVDRIDAHLDGLRVAGNVGVDIAKQYYAENPEAGELFVVRMLSTKEPVLVSELDLATVRIYLAATLHR